MIYLYNEKENCFAVYTNFKPKDIPAGYKVISEKKFYELQSKLDIENNKENKEENENV